MLKQFCRWLQYRSTHILYNCGTLNIPACKIVNCFHTAPHLLHAQRLGYFLKYKLEYILVPTVDNEEDIYKDSLSSNAV